MSTATPERPPVAEMQPFRATNLVAVYGDPQSARDALTSLERSGLDGLCTSFVSGAPSPASADRRFAGLTARNLGFGALIGIVLGLVAGVATAAVLDATIDVSASAIWAASLTGLAAFGASAGAFYTLFAHTAASSAWSETFAADPSASARIVVHLDDADRLDEVTSALEDKDPVVVRVLDRRGRPVHRSAA